MAADHDTVHAENLKIIHPQTPDTITDDIPLPQVFTPASSMLEDYNDVYTENEKNAATETDVEPLPPNTIEINYDDVNQKSRRVTAIKATERFEEWTPQSCRRGVSRKRESLGECLAL